MNNTRKALTAIVAGAALALTPVLSTAVHAAPPAKCEFRLGTVEAVDLNHNNGTDFVFLRVGGVWGPSGNDGVEFTAGDRLAAATEFDPADRITFTDEIEVRLVLDLFPTNYTVDTVTLPCTEIPATQQKFESGNGKIEYHVGYRVIEVD